MEVISIPLSAHFNTGALEWAKTHCQSFIKSSFVTNNNEVDIGVQYTILVEYYFKSKEDALYFALTWSSK